MKFTKKAVITLIFFISAAAYSQNQVNTVWESPSYEAGYKMASGMTNINSAIETGSQSDFTPALDYKISEEGLMVITFTLTKTGFVNIKIYDEKGNTVDEIKRSSFTAGEHEIKWNSSKFTNGSYYCSVITGEFSKTKKIK